MDWYVSRGGSKRGPISDSDLRRHIQAGHLRPTDMVWHNSMPEWKLAGEVDGLFQPSPPPPAFKRPLQSDRPATATAANGAAWPATSNPKENLTGSYLLNHWQGRLGLATSFWLNTILFGFLFSFLMSVFFGLSAAMLGEGVGLLFLFLPIVWLAFVIWQHVGLYRCGLAHIFAPQPQFKLWAHLSVIWSVLPIALIPLIVVAVIGGVAALGAQSSAEFDRIAAEIEAGGY